MTSVRSVHVRQQGALMVRYMAVVLVMSLPAACGGGGGGGSDSKTDGGTRLIDAETGLPTPRNLLPSLAVADANFESDHFSGSGNCVACHTDDAMTVTTDAGERDVSIGTAWETSMMANAVRDPYWHAVVAYELDRFPMHDEEINDTCTRCHAPMASEYAKKTGTALRLFDSGSEADGTLLAGLLGSAAKDETATTLFDHAMDGVSCTLCHQMDPDNLGEGNNLPVESQTGGFVIKDFSGSDISERPAYAQYDDPSSSYMRQQVSFNAKLGAHLGEAETCGTCHNLNIEPIDKEGNPLDDVGHFAEQANYSEWLFSDFRKGGPEERSCQSCHMPVLEQDVVIADGSGLAKRPDFAEHTILGANTVMQSMLRDHADELGVPPGVDFDASIERNREFLTTAASLEISGTGLTPLAQSGDGDNTTSGNQAVGDAQTLAFDVQVSNDTGHKLPSGYHARRVYLHVQVANASGEVVFESGRINADGSIVGVAEDVNPAIWEPHHDVITSERQVQVYQSIVGNSDDERTHSLLNGSFFLKDNRLTPRGFSKRDVTGNPAVAASFGVFGGAMGDDDFDSGRDTVSYRVRVPAAGEYSVRAELRYQPLSFGHLRELFRESDRIDQVDAFRTMYDTTTLRDEVIDAVTTTVF